MPTVLNRPVLPDDFEYGLGSNAQTRRAVKGLVVGMNSRMPELRTAIIVGLPGKCYLDHSGGGMARGEAR